MHHTVAALKDFNDLKDDLRGLFDYFDLTAGNDSVKLELTGMPIAIPSGHGSPEPQTGQVTSVTVIAEGGLLFRAEFEADEFAHHFRGRTRIKGLTPPATWFDEGESQNHTMYFTGKQYPRATEVEVEILSSGTQGEANDWSVAESEIIK